METIFNSEVKQLYPHEGKTTLVYLYYEKDDDPTPSKEGGRSYNSPIVFPMIRISGLTP